MSGKSDATQQSSQTSQLTGYAPAMAGVNGVISAMMPSIGNLSGGPLVSTALNQLAGIAQSPNQLGPLAMNAVGSLLGGGANYGAATNTLMDAYGAGRAALSPYLSGSALDPSQNAALGKALSNIQTDVTNSVNPTFAAAGRLGSPDNAMAVARGISQGEAQAYQNAQQNQLQAAGLLNSTAGGTASGLTGADVANAGIQSQGINNAANAYGAQTLGSQALLNVGLTGASLPLTFGQQLMSIFAQPAATFGQNTGNSNTDSTQTMSPAQEAMGFGNMIANLIGAYNKKA
jgi:hypothetical protein